jgi:hypothetical protein
MSLIRRLLVMTVLLGVSVTSNASAQGSSLARSDRASTTSSVPAEVLVVLAKEEPGKIDPQLQKLTALRRPPFNSFRSMTILSRPKLKLTPGKDALVSLPNGRRMKLTLLRVMPDGRYKVKAAINRPDDARRWRHRRSEEDRTIGARGRPRCDRDRGPSPARAISRGGD